MMRINKAVTATALFGLAGLGLAGLGACTTTGTRNHAGAVACQATAAAKLVGQVAPGDATILR